MIQPHRPKVILALAVDKDAESKEDDAPGADLLEDCPT